MIPVAKQLGFNSVLVTYLREKGYSAHIVKSGFYAANPTFNSRDIVCCVEVGFPRPAIRFMCIDGPAGYCSICAYHILKKEKTNKGMEYKAIDSIYAPDLLEKIEEIINQI